MLCRQKNGVIVMYRDIEEIIIYRDNIKDTILSEMGSIFRDYENDKEYDRAAITGRIYEQVNKLLDVATDYGFDGNLWQNYIAYILASGENPFTITCERTGAQDGTVNEFVKEDLMHFHNILNYDFSAIERELGINCFSRITNYKSLVKPERRFNKSVSNCVKELSSKLDGCDSADRLYEIVTDFYKTYGVGMYGLNKAFRIKNIDGETILEPITNTADIRLDDIIGYESQKKQLVGNTKAFVEGKLANNVLLCGDSGTGKSTSIKAILNEYYDDGLRIIEVYKHQFKDLSKVIEMVKDRNYKFIIYMDDLSFEDFEIEYKYLKAVIEGGLEIRPDNVLIYATSNRRHLVKESWKDRDDMDMDIHHSDTMQEKLSLAARFGLTIYYGRPAKKEYDDIVRGIAKQYPELKVSEEELLLEANRWSLSNGGFSGRAARQMVISLLSEQDKKS